MTGLYPLVHSLGCPSCMSRGGHSAACVVNAAQIKLGPYQCHMSSRECGKDCRAFSVPVQRPGLFGISHRGRKVPTEPIAECSGRCDRYIRAKCDTRYSVETILWVWGAHAVHSSGKREDKLSVASVRVTHQTAIEVCGCECAQGKMKMRSNAHSARTRNVAISL